MEIFRVKYDKHNGKPRLRAWEKGMPIFHITYENFKNRQFLVCVLKEWHIANLFYHETFGYTLILVSNDIIEINKQTEVYLLPKNY